MSLSKLWRRFAACVTVTINPRFEEPLLLATVSSG
jgi:hypothetical protein